MFKWLISHAPPRRGPLRWALLPLPERLLEINREAARSPHFEPDEVDEFSEIVTSLWINQVNKRTARDRLPDTLRAIAAALPREIRSLRFLDLGASDAVSTYDAVCFFRDTLGMAVTAHAVDLYTQLHRFDGRFLCEYRTSDGSAVLVRLSRIGLRLGRRLAFRPTELLRSKYLASRRVRSKLRQSLSIPLIHPLAAADPDINVVESDALVRQPEFHQAFNVVRISNLLNHSYFTRPQMEAIVGHATSYLEVGGLLVISRNETESGGVAERGTVWRRARSGLTWTADFNGGSELRSLMEQFEPPQLTRATRTAA